MRSSGSSTPSPSSRGGAPGPPPDTIWCQGKTMARMITLAAAQTGPVLSDDWRDGVAGACKMIEQAARKNADIVCFPELFLTPFFPNRLTHDFDRYFIALPDKGAAPIFQAAADHRVALLFPYGAKHGP